MNRHIKNYLQTFVVVTSFPPLRQLYIGFYHFVIWLVTRRLARNPDVVSVYLNRGCARGEITPGISDIDMAVMVKADSAMSVETYQSRTGSSKEPDRMDLQNLGWYKKYASYFPLLEPDLPIKVWSEYREGLLNYSRNWRRLDEAKTTFRLMYGKDLYGELPAPKREDLDEGMSAEIHRRGWMLFIKPFLHSHEADQHTLTRNSLCYRACCELIKMAQAMLGAPLFYNRKGVLQKFKGQLPESELPFIEKMERLEARRFLPNDATIVEETKEFLLTYMDRFFGEYSSKTPARPASCPQVVDCPADECFDTSQGRVHLEKLMVYLEAQWGPIFRGAYLARSVFMSLEEQVLLIQVDPQHLPTMAQLADFLQVYEGIQSQLDHLLYPYLLLPNAAYLIGGKKSKKDAPKLLFPVLPQFYNYDVFSQLNQPENILRDGGYRAAPSTSFPAYIAEFVSEHKSSRYKKLKAGLLEGGDDLRFARTLWKYLQMVVMTHSLARGEVLYPLTLAAIERGLAAAGIPLPARLNNMAAAYEKLLAGQKVDLTKEKEAALSYILEIDPEGKVFSDLSPNNRASRAIQSKQLVSN